ncbi:hypothetical protein KTR66_00795 [Roseococcus sp. SDR]|uniref:hypothetical protein n=1 Tax=Roseococcus sp. SDR TaxID=2835532 RepID=UPI001BCA93EE|nr:hypothetical protein [Roseococcus sp. SDR]MBS7788507.1 hypothetical protein [Roseococcus sp. SDR]MBV1843821.1 hypothetical protein [Roseococcus sp. SDR]
MRLALLALLGLLLPSASRAQQAPVCAASGHEPLRSAAEVMADVARHRCMAGSRLDVALTVAGQAITLQTSGLCDADSVRTRTVRPTPETRALGFTCLLAPR